MAKKMDELFDHDYDGIREFDNDLPGWWVWLFIITIIFSVLYLGYFHVLGIGDSSRVKYLKQIDPNYRPLPQDENRSLAGMVFPTYNSPFYVPRYEMMQQDLRGTGAQIAAAMAAAATQEIDSTVVPATDTAALEAGRQIYAQYCFTCHGMAGEGGIGPNLTDNFWVHGGSFPEIVHTVKVGVPVKGMIAWETQLTAEQILNVSSYVQTLIGTNPANPKPPQGEEYVMGE